MTTKPKTDFVRARRMHERGNYDEAVIHAILDAAPLCHIGHIIDGRPVVLPTFHWRHGNTVYWHGSAASRMLRNNGSGAPVCLTVTMMDGFVLARSAFHHSVNYRSVLCFGAARLITDVAEKTAALKGFTDRLFPGRWDQLRPMQDQELKATAVLALEINEVSAKLRTCMPGDDPEDVTWPVWAGVLPVHMATGTPQPDQHVIDPTLQPPATPFTQG